MKEQDEEIEKITYKQTKFYCYNKTNHEAYIEMFRDNFSVRFATSIYNNEQLNLFCNVSGIYKIKMDFSKPKGSEESRFFSFNTEKVLCEFEKFFNTNDTVYIYVYDDYLLLKIDDSETKIEY